MLFLSLTFHWLLLLIFVHEASPKEDVITESPPETPLDIPDWESTDVVAISRDDLVALYSSLLSSYDPRIRPLVDQSFTVSVKTKFVPKGLITFDTSEQRFSIIFYIKAEWNDQQLTWKADSYGGTNVIKLPMKNIWVPKLKIVEEFDGRNYIGESTDIAKIGSEGDVQWVPEGMYSVVCEVDIQYYPYDEQMCTFTYYIANEANNTVSLVHTDEVSLDEYMENAAWTVVEITRERELRWGTYFINIHFKLQRRAHFATFTIVTPLLMLAFLNIGVFLVPNGSGEKGTFAITIFLAYGIFITLVSDTLPHNSMQTSYFVVFIISLLAVSVLSVLYAVLQAKLFATIGSKECKLPFGKQTFNNSKVASFHGQDQTRGSTGAQESSTFTWGMLLDKIDAVVCVAFFIAVSITTVVFFCIMLKHTTKAK